MAWVSDVAALLWRSAWAVVPLVVIVAAICRWVPCRPVTRHALWVIVLASFAAPLLATAVPMGELLPRLDTRPDEPEATILPAAGSPLPKVSWRSGDEPGTSDALPGALAGEAALSELPAPRAHTLMPRDAMAGRIARNPGGPDGDSRVSSRSFAPDRASPIPDLPVGGSSEPFQVRDPEDTTRDVRERAATAERYTDRVWFGVPHVEGAVPASPRTEPVSPFVGEGAPVAERRAAGEAVAAAEEVGGVQVAKDSGRAISSEPAWSAWLVALAGVRDALVNLPALPMGFWCGGIGVVVVVYVLGTACTCWRFRKARRAPRSVEKAVAAVARKIGLSRAPQTLMVDEPISPLVWCGRRTRLILPTALWSQMDRVGRQAILCHELAHLRRRDHWVRWFELLVSVVFWWHPLMWWVRRRVDEEADLCCDAWVTWLMPRRRRAYAEALLRARQFSGDGRQVTPAVAMGVASAGAKRFSRRITMVMTQNARPGISVAGVGLMLVLAFAGWVATPAWSCPPTEQGDTKASCDVKTTCDAKCDAKTKCDAHAQGTTAIAIVDAARPAAEAAPVIAADVLAKVLGGTAGDEEVCVTVSPQAKEVWFTPDEKSITYSFTTGTDEPLIWTSAALGDLDEVDGQLAKKLAKLDKELERLNAEMKALSVQIKVGKPKVLKVPSGGIGGSTGQTMLFGKGGGYAGLGRMLGGGEEVTRAYKLPKGKLEMLSELMIRQDVPIKVRPHDDRIEVIATEAQHHAFEAFLGLLDDNTSWQEYALPEGKLEALSNLMIRSDVPILVQPQKDRLRAQVTDGQDKIFKAFIELIHPTGKGGKVKVFGYGGAGGDADARKVFEKYIVKGGPDGEAFSKAAEAFEKAHIDLEKLGDYEHEIKVLREADVEKIKEHAKEIAEQARRQKREYEIKVLEHAENLHEHSEDLHEHEVEAAIEAEIAALIEQAKALAKEAEFLEQQADNLHLEAGALEDESPKKARLLEQKAREMEREARGLERKAERLERQADRMVERAERERDDD